MPLISSRKPSGISSIITSNSYAGFVSITNAAYAIALLLLSWLEEMQLVVEPRRGVEDVLDRIDQHPLLRLQWRAIDFHDQ